VNGQLKQCKSDALELTNHSMWKAITGYTELNYKESFVRKYRSSNVNVECR